MPRNMEGNFSPLSFLISSVERIFVTGNTKKINNNKNMKKRMT